MTPTNGNGLGNTGWTYSFTAADLGPDHQGGTTDDFQIDIIVHYKLPVLSGLCTDCPGCDHDRNQKRFWGRSPNGQGNQRCMMIFTGQPYNVIYTIGGFPTSSCPLQAACDQCHGCEACDVDGPMFIGGEPDGFVAGPNPGNCGQNFDPTSHQIMAVKKSTMARAVFDNIIIKNNRERRTDFDPTAPGTFEDRFFESQLSVVASANTDANFGAVYRRGLLELQGFRAKLGTLSWTSYPSVTTGPVTQEFECMVERLPGGSGPTPTFNSSNAGIAGSPASGTPITEANGALNRVIGYSFAGQPPFDATSDPNATGGVSYPKEMLLLNVQYNNRGQTRGGALPQPMVETPFFEDVTLTLIRESVQILYAEEGIEE
jgi:hypothetical protein